MASSAPDGAPSSSQSGTRSVRIKVMDPGVTEPQILSRDVILTSTVRDLKEQIKPATSAGSDPDSQRLRLIYQGKQLVDDTVLGDAFHNTPDNTTPINLHVVVRPNPNDSTSTTVPARSFFGARSGTPNQPVRTPTAPSGPSPVPPTASASTSQAGTPGATPVPPGAPRVLPQGAQTQIFINRQVTITTTGHVVRRQTTSSQNMNLTHAERHAQAVADALQNARNMNQQEGNSSGSGARPNTQTTTRTINITQTPNGANGTTTPGNQNTFTTTHSFGVPNLGPFPRLNVLETMPSLAPSPQYWLLQGPDGQASILLSNNPAPTNIPFAFHPPRISPLAPIGSGLAPPPGLNINDVTTSIPSEGLQNQLEQVGGLTDALSTDMAELELQHQQMMTRLHEARARLTQMQLQDQLNLEELRNYQAQGPAPVPAAAPVPAPGAAAAAAPAPQGLAAQNRQILLQNPINNILDLLLWVVGWGNAAAPAPTAQVIENYIRLFLENIWLAARLAFAVYLLGGGRDFRRDAVLWGVAAIIFVWQSGIFDTWLLPLIRHINDMIPDPNRPPPAPAQGQPAGGAQAEGQGGLPNVQDVANRWVQQHRDRQGGGIFDTIQNSVSIFLASLVPGLGERIGNARAAEMERQRRAIEDAQAATQAPQGEGAEANADAPAEGGAANQPPAQAPGPQDNNIMNAARDHFGDDRARELFGGPPEQGEEPQAMFGF
ncbi:hypothetical protein TWF694_008815 [Orbilia ellipsospora]|uniref:Ubiquitin-like domain-containing protein n=1 Tax=Orbilia ellipsospora TaxID=2528407 RepID=A0AAV9XEG6_9PEZI